MRAFSRRAAALRRMDSSLSIRAWLRGVLGKLTCEERRKRCTSSSAPLAAIAETDGRGAAGTFLPGTIDLKLADLTPAQREVLELRIKGVKDREGARGLAISRGAYRGRVARAIRNLREADEKPGNSRIWASLLLAQRLVPPHRMEPGEPRKLLMHHVRGYSQEAIAKKMCTTVASVKNRLKRWKSWWRERREKEKTVPGLIPGGANLAHRGRHN